ncbi:MAG: RNA pseudouridine synthase [Clostridia bacterium]|nr:RNA pseudouridine synthase [Clostridia bacterium]
MEKLEILYEDRQIIVVLKPQNVPSQADETGDLDMLNIVKNHIKEDLNKDNVYVGLVHRLDRPTGGIMVFAKTSKSASRLSAQIESGELEKSYLVVTKGKPVLLHGTLINFLKKDEKQNKVSIVPQSTDGAKRAELEYNVLESKNDLSLIQVKLKTGRGHQIRVQFSNIKCPVFGDQKYGGKNMPKVNLNLFAYELKFTHPTTKERLTFRSYPPEDMEAWKNFNLDKYLKLSINN